MGIEDADLFSYILPQDGRSYTAVAKIPERLGFDLQSVIVLGTSIAWLFSSSEKAPNGFTLTGNKLFLIIARQNLSKSVRFPESLHITYMQ